MTRRVAALAWAERILGVPALPYQSLHLPVSSQHGVHADEILMTTRPRGYMLAVWYALEDIAPDSGPLVLWPGSHRLPFVSARSIGIPEDASEAERGARFDERYFPRMRAVAEASGLEPWRFVPRVGDALFWHSNVLHGAVAPEREGATRRSLVVHYFGAGAEHYSDLYGRPCAIPELE